MKILVRLLILLHFLLNKLGIRLRGLGAAQRLLKRTFTFKAFGKKFYYDPSVEGSYDYLLIGQSNEPETHKLLNKILKYAEAFNFIDVGASVGEFVTFASRYNNIQNIYAFEPRPDCASVLKKSAELNKEGRIKVFEYAVNDKGQGNISFHLNAGGNSSGFYNLPGQTTNRLIEAKTITLDKALPYYFKNPILLIDVEGAEPIVIKGALNFIRLNNPLIIFEYNQFSRQYYQLEEIIDMLGSGYNIYRLLGDGNLDKNFNNSYNCVAIPCNTEFSTILQSSIILSD